MKTTPDLWLGLALGVLTVATVVTLSWWWQHRRARRASADEALRRYVHGECEVVQDAVLTSADRTRRLVLEALKALPAAGVDEAALARRVTELEQERAERRAQTERLRKWQAAAMRHDPRGGPITDLSESDVAPG